MGEVKKDDGSNDAIMYAAAAIAILGAVFWALARLPAFIFGALAGFAVSANFSRRQEVIPKLKAAVGTGVFFYFILYLCFGFQGLMHSDFTGVLYKFAWYRNSIIDLVGWWNGFVPNLLKGLRVKDALVTTDNVSHLILTSAITGTLVAVIVPPILKRILPKKEKDFSANLNENTGFFIQISEFPYKVFHALVEYPFTRLVQMSHDSAVKTRRIDPREGVMFLAFLGILLGIGFCLSKIPSFLSTESKETTFLVGTVFAYAPLTFAAFGFLVGLIPVIGDWVLFHFFRSHPEDVEIPGLKKKVLPGFSLGVGENRKPFLLTENNLSYHVELVAPTGSGKTNLLKNLLVDRISKGHGIIFLDYKADFDVLSWMYRVAKSNNRRDDLRLISLSDKELSVPYNPIEGGSASELTSRILNSFEWSTEQYYFNAAKSALSRVLRGFVEYRDYTKSPFHVGHIYRGLTDSNYLRLMAAELKKNNSKNHFDLIEIAERLDRPSDAKEIRGLVTNLETLILSSVGQLLSTDTESGAYTLKEAVYESRITYCLMNSLLHKESSKALGKLFLQDLMGFIGRRFASIERGEDHHTPVTLIIDEFAAFAMPEFIEFLDRARSAGISVIIAHQDRADLRSISEEFQSRVEANTNTTIVSGVKDPKDADHYAGMMGTKKVMKETIRVTSGGWSGDTPTGDKSVREVDEFVLHPNKIRSLKQGEVLSISRTIDPHFGIVWIPKASDFSEAPASTSELMEYFKNSRGLYLRETKINSFSVLGRSSEQPGLRVETKGESKQKQTEAEKWN